MKEADPLATRLRNEQPQGGDAMSNPYPDGNEPQCYSGDGPWRNSPEPKREPQIGGYHSIMGEALIAPSPAPSTHKAAGHVVEPLYTAPHRPDASGLVEAAEAYEHASEMATMKAADLEIHKTQQFGITALSNLASELLDEAHALRSRAADSSATRAEGWEMTDAQQYADHEGEFKAMESLG